MVYKIQDSKGKNKQNKSWWFPHIVPITLRWLLSYEFTIEHMALFPLQMSFFYLNFKILKDKNHSSSSFS